MKNVLFINLGGTISAIGKTRTDLKDYISGKVTGEQFIAELDELQNIAHIDVEQFANVSSTEITAIHWMKLKERIDKGLNEEQYDAVVITQGTNTLEETAYFLHLTVSSEKPVVLVGAQRPYTSLSSDAHLNLLQAFLVATAEQSFGKGVLVVLNGEISSARDVTKTDTYRLNNFHANGLGFLGFIDPDQTVQYYRHPTRKHTINSIFSNVKINEMPKVEIIYSYAGATGELIHYVANTAAYDGIIMAGTGAGRFSSAEKAALKYASDKGITVVRSSRVGSGRVVPIEPLIDLPAVCSDNLTPQKARILLMVALLKYRDLPSLQKIFDTY